MRPPVHERVKGHFDDAGLSFADIAQAAARQTRRKWSERKVARLLTGTTDLKVKHLEVFAGILGKSVTDLYEATAPKQTSRGRRAS